MNTENDFVKCSNGHIYRKALNECPYCAGVTLDEELEKLSSRGYTPREISACCYTMQAIKTDEKPRGEKPHGCKWKLITGLVVGIISAIGLIYILFFR